MVTNMLKCIVPEAVAEEIQVALSSYGSEA